MKVTIIGTGYVGLTTGVCLSKVGHEVCCIDSNSELVKNINKGIAHIYESNLEDILNDVLRKKRFIASEDLNSALEISDIVLIAVGTPSISGKIDLSFIRNVGIQIGSWLKSKKKFLPLIIKSTVIPKTTDTFFKGIIEESSGVKFPEFGLGMNPEFLREGSAINDFNYPDRIILGYEDNATCKALLKLYEPFNCKKILVNTRTAEFIKYVNNSLLATQISFANEMANLAGVIKNIDYKEVLEGVISDHRWGIKDLENNNINPEVVGYLNPGCGFGGSCFPKDLEAIKYLGNECGLSMKILDSVLEVNKNQHKQILSQLSEEINCFKNKFSVLILGLSFKPNTDDVRSSPSEKIITDLLKKDIKLYAHDPISIDKFKNEFFPEEINIKFIHKWKEILNEVEVIIIVTAWDEYKSVEEVALKKHIIIDPRRMLNLKKLDVRSYKSIGYNFD